MNYTHLLRGSLLLAAVIAGAVPSSAPVFENEQLRYSINWPSGLSLGEASLSASGSPARYRFNFDIDAGVPGFGVADRYRSQAVDDFCSTEFLRTTKHGSKKIDEKMTFDPHQGTVTRGAVSGESTEISAAPCSKDALTYLYYARRELSQGRIPQRQTIFLGAQYEISLEFGGTQTVRIGDKAVETERVTASAKGPASNIGFEVYFLKDRARTPALVRVPLELGTFSMELVK
jgi:Protein of unknown function (DUF3108)